MFQRCLQVLMLIPLIFAKESTTTTTTTAPLRVSLLFSITSTRRASSTTAVLTPSVHSTNDPLTKTTLTTGVSRPRTTSIENQQNFTQPSLPEFLDVVFDRQFHVVFGKEQLSLFHDCLCSNNTKSCVFTSENDTTRADYKTVIGVKRKNLTMSIFGDTLGTTFLCQGRFVDKSLRCSRQESESEMFQPDNKTLTSITFSNPDCDAVWVNIGWEGDDQLVEFLTERSDGVLSTVGPPSGIGISSGSSPPAGHNDSKQWKGIYIGLGVGVSFAVILIISITICWKYGYYKSVLLLKSKFKRRSSTQLSCLREDYKRNKFPDKQKIIAENARGESSPGGIELEKSVYENESFQEKQGSHYVNFQQLQASLGPQHRKDDKESAADEIYGNSAVLSSTVKAANRENVHSSSSNESANYKECSDYGQEESIYGNIRTNVDPDCEYVAVDELTEMKMRDFFIEEQNPGIMDETRDIQTAQNSKDSQNPKSQAEDIAFPIGQAQEAFDIAPLKPSNQTEQTSGSRSLHLEKNGRRDLRDKPKSVYTRISVGRDGVPKEVCESVDGPYNTASGAFDTFIEQKRRTSSAHVSIPYSETSAKDSISFTSFAPERSDQNGFSEFGQRLHSHHEDSRHTMIEENVCNNDISDHKNRGGENKDTHHNVYFELEAQK